MPPPRNKAAGAAFPKGLNIFYACLLPSQAPFFSQSPRTTWARGMRAAAAITSRLQRLAKAKERQVVPECAGQAQAEAPSGAARHDH